MPSSTHAGRNYMVNDRKSTSGGRRVWLVQSKLEAPRQQTKTIDRNELIAALNNMLDRGLGLIVAPPGFGKSTLLAQWRQYLLSKDIKVAWLTLDEGDTESSQFLSYLVYAMSTAGVNVGQLEMLAEQGLIDTPPKSALSSILEAVSVDEKTVLLIIDDYQRAQCEAIDKLVTEFVHSAPQNLKVIINSRTRPSINLPQLLASGLASEIGADELRFSREEMRQAIDIELSDRILDDLFLRTEGWPVAIQLAAFLMRERDEDRQKNLDWFAGHSGHVGSYLADQVLATLPDKVQEFLIKTSVAERFNASLANAICGRDDSWQILAELEALHALVIPLDDSQTWFRFHHLFSEYLTGLLNKKFPGLEKELHQRASEWFESEQQIAEAVMHARLAGEYERCAALIEQAGGWELILFGGIGYLRNLLRNVPEDELFKFPRLQMARAYLCMKEGRVRDARAYFDAAVASENLSIDDVEWSRDVVNMRAMIECYEDRKVTSTAVMELSKRAENWPKSDALTRGMLFCQLALAKLSLGAFNEAEEVSLEAMRAMRQAQSVLGLNYCYLHAGLANFFQARFQMAEAYLLESRTMAEDNFGADSGPKFTSDVLIYGLRYWRDELAEDERPLFWKALKHVSSHDGWFDIYAFGYLTAFEMALSGGDSNSALRLVNEARALANQRGLKRLADLADVVEFKLKIRTGKKASNQIPLFEIEKRYEIGGCDSNPNSWRSYLEFADIGVGSFEPNLSRQSILDDAINAARRMGANFYLIRLLIRRASLSEEIGARDAALADIAEALRLAAPEGIQQPFQSDRSISSLLRTTQKMIRQNSGNSLITRFVSVIVDRARRTQLDRQSSCECSVLSPREQDVLIELSLGQSNKQIARSLDMTENTVKFHLKNIFAKMGVESRGQLISKLGGDRL